jgi:hypothetical protein
MHKQIKGSQDQGGPLRSGLGENLCLHACVAGAGGVGVVLGCWVLDAWRIPPWNVPIMDSPRTDDCGNAGLESCQTAIGGLDPSSIQPTGRSQPLIG